MDEPTPELKQLLKSFKTYLINGKHIQRVKYTPKQYDPGSCEICGVNRGSYHKLGCEREPAVCGKCKFMLQCECPVREDEEV